jgi:heme/copper-type cytochrome/quinol oxidase subunit 1
MRGRVTGWITTTDHKRIGILYICTALVFLAAGGMKLLVPLDVLSDQMQLALPGIFIRFTGLCEVLGALGLILPGLTRIRPELTSLAARGLVLIMVGATMFTPPEQLSLAALPVTIGLLAAFVAYGRAPRNAQQRTRRPAPQAA